MNNNLTLAKLIRELNKETGLVYTIKEESMRPNPLLMLYKKHILEEEIIEMKKGYLLLKQPKRFWKVAEYLLETGVYPSETEYPFKYERLKIKFLKPIILNGKEINSCRRIMTIDYLFNKIELRVEDHPENPLPVELFINDSIKIADLKYGVSKGFF